jgi:hypothetical protein
MRRRGGTARFKCAQEGCSEWSFFEYRTQAEASRLYATYSGTWKCIRHTRPQEWLTPENPSREITLTVEQREHGRYWSGINNGYAHGPGFQAYSDEFPPGTTLRISARLSLPEPPK